MGLKIRPASRTVGFFESFSDLIFATMAIFVLLMVIFLVLANESNPVRQAKHELQRIESMIEEARKEASQAREQAQSLAESVEELAEKEVEIAIVVDKTGSMEQELYNLKNAITRLADILPKVMDAVRMSVVGYRISEAGVNQTELFQMSDIREAMDDDGASIRRLKSFLARQKHVSGTAPILEATRAAIDQFSDGKSFKGHQVLMILGDVGPYETKYYDADMITPAGRQKARQLRDLVATWSNGRKNRNLILMFSGRDEVNRFGVDSSNARREKHRLSMQLFKEIATASGQPDAYTENQASMFVDFLVAALKRQ